MTTAQPIAGSQSPVLPPMLPYWGPWGHIPELRRDNVGLVVRAWRECGPIVRISFGFLTPIFVFDAGAAKRVLVDKQHQYSKQTRGYDALRILLGQGLVTSEGALWKRQRRIAQPAFHKERIAKMVDTMREASSDMVERWAPWAERRTEFDVAEEMMRVTLRIAGETLCSVDLSDDSSEFGRGVSVMLKFFRKKISTPLPLHWKLPTAQQRRSDDALQTMDRIVYEIIDERLESGVHGDDLLGMFMSARDVETGEGMTRTQLRDEVMTMLSAGHETTANALAWTLYLLSQHPDVVRRLEREVDAALDHPGDAPSADQLKSLPYAEQILSESMRLYPPVWAVARRAEVDDEILGFSVPKDSYVVMSPWVVHRDPELWENPEGFDPDRFSPERLAEAKSRGRPRTAYFPFASGPRKCIGDAFARTEALVLLATIARAYRVELRPHQRVVPEGSVTLRPRDGIRVTLRRR